MPVAHLDLYRLVASTPRSGATSSPTSTGRSPSSSGPSTAPPGSRDRARRLPSVTSTSRTAACGSGVKTILAFDTATSFGAVCGLASGRRARAGRPATCSSPWTSSSTTRRRSRDRRRPRPRELHEHPHRARDVALARSGARRPCRRRLDLDGYRGALPVIDARRGEVFTAGPRVCRPEELQVAGQTLAGDGALRYRACSRRRERRSRPTTTRSTCPIRCCLLERAGAFGDAELVEPLYVREPDARPAA